MNGTLLLQFSLLHMVEEIGTEVKQKVDHYSLQNKEFLQRSENSSVLVYINLFIRHKHTHLLDNY